MMNAAGAVRERHGFSGAIGGLTFADVIQLKGLNHFSGCVTVEFQEEIGKIYFRDGEVIHAELGAQVGKEAFYQIFLWPSGNFQTYPNVVSTSHSIDCSWKFLLLEAHQMHDEGRLSRAATDQAERRAEEVPMAEAKAGESIITRQLRDVNGVTELVLHTREGLPLEDATFAKETIAAHASFLVQYADRLGEIFGVGPVRSAAVEGEAAHLLLFESKRSYLTMTIDGKRLLGEVEAEVRASVSARKQVRPC
jgi:predicted regulator of Ras-like GTPase activity (Roadblock/LC7/MglB family)